MIDAESCSKLRQWQLSPTFLPFAMASHLIKSGRSFSCLLRCFGKGTQSKLDREYLTANEHDGLVYDNKACSCPSK